MADTKKIRFLTRAGDPRTGIIIQPGTVTDFPAVWADRYVRQGIAEEVKVKEPKKPADKPPKGKGKKS